MAKQKKKKIWKWLVAGILLFIVAVCGICYAGVTHYYTTHFFKGTIINGIDCSNMTVEEVKYKIEDEIMTYAISVKERGGVTERLLASQLGMTYVDDQSVDRLMEEQKPHTWITHLSNEAETTVSAATEYDKERTDQSVKALQAFAEGNYISPEDARVEKGETSYEIIPEVEGNELKLDEVLKAVHAAVENNETEVNLDELGCYKEPEVRSDNKRLKNLVKSSNKYLTSETTYDFGGGDRDVVVGSEQVMEWLVEGDDGKFTLDEEKVAEFVKIQMAYKYDTFGLTHTFKTHGGKTIELKGGDYGWCINRDKTTEQLIEAIQSGEKQTLEPVYLYSAKDRSANDIGGTYVEISISAQKMWCYKDGTCIVATDVVTGCPAKGNDTPKGSVWAIDAKKRNATLGTMDTMGYSSPVDFWMPFTGNVGIHDAAWRNKFGGSIYKNNGSHGCVNTPHSAAEKIYNTVEIGTAVIVY